MASLAPVILTALLCSGATYAQPTPEQECEAAKNQIAGKYALCRQKARKALLLTGDVAAYNDAIVMCGKDYAHNWKQAEQAAVDAGTTCPTMGDRPSMKSFITAHTTAVSTALSGSGLPRCGDGVINVAGEHCDGTDLGSATCVTLGFASGTLACGGSCAFDTSGCISTLVCAGQVVEGACWFLGADGESCTTACSNHCLSYNPATNTAGTSNASCQAVTEAFGNTWSGSAFDVLEGNYGCFSVVGHNDGRRDTSGADAGSAISSVLRYCACQ